MQLFEIIIQFANPNDEAPWDDPGEVPLRFGPGPALSTIADGVGEIVRTEGWMTRTLSHYRDSYEEPTPDGPQAVSKTKVVTSPWTLPDPD